MSISLFLFFSTNQLAITGYGKTVFDADFIVFFFVFKQIGQRGVLPRFKHWNGLSFVFKVAVG